MSREIQRFEPIVRSSGTRRIIDRIPRELLGATFESSIGLYLPDHTQWGNAPRYFETAGVVSVEQQNPKTGQATTYSMIEDLLRGKKHSLEPRPVCILDPVDNHAFVLRYYHGPTDTTLVISGTIQDFEEEYRRHPEARMIYQRMRQVPPCKKPECYTPGLFFLGDAHPPDKDHPDGTFMPIVQVCIDHIVYAFDQMAPVMTERRALQMEVRPINPYQPSPVDNENVRAVLLHHAARRKGKK